MLCYGPEQIIVDRSDSQITAEVGQNPFLLTRKLWHLFMVHVIIDINILKTNALTGAITPSYFMSLESTQRKLCIHGPAFVFL